MLDPTQSDARDRLERAAADPHLHCVCLFPAMHGYTMTDVRLTPLLEIVAQGRTSAPASFGRR